MIKSTLLGEGGKIVETFSMDGVEKKEDRIPGWIILYLSHIVSLLLMVILYHLTNFYNDQSKNMTGFDVQGRPFIRNLSSK